MIYVPIVLKCKHQSPQKRSSPRKTRTFNLPVVAKLKSNTIPTAEGFEEACLTAGRANQLRHKTWWMERHGKGWCLIWRGGWGDDMGELEGIEGDIGRKKVREVEAMSATRTSTVT